MRRLPLQTVIRWLAITAVICFALQVFSDNKADVDLWGNVGFVRALPGSPDFLTTNSYSYTEPDAPWVNHEWLAEYLLHGTWRLLGNPGLLLLKIMLGLSVLALMHNTLRRECRSGPLRLLLLLLMISTMSYGFSTRPHHFTYLLLAIFLALLKRYGGRAWLHLGVLPALAILWANLHGAFFIGAIVLIVYAVAETACNRRSTEPVWRRPAILFGGVVLFVAASMINPFGARLWGFIFESGVSARPYLSEWEPFSPIRHGMTHLDFVFLALLACCAFPFSRTPKAVAWTALLYLSLLAAIILRRNIPLFAIVTAFTIGPHVEDMVGKRLEGLAVRLPAWLLALLLLCFIPLSLYSAATFNKQSPCQIEIPADRYPLRVVAFMKAHDLSGNAFVFFDWAEYCIWHLYPDCRVFLDGRFRSAYSAPVVSDYLAGLYGRPGWDRVLTQYPTDMALVHFGNPIAQKLSNHPGWALVFADGPACLYLKRSVHAEALEAMRRGTWLDMPEPRALFP
ncbi:MAG: hypothetical protein HQ523_04110 [Lentisphaerae bacterium]|nr:hypothetical protein [Lentisphaerota bacterium]